MYGRVRYEVLQSEYPSLALIFSNDELARKCEPPNARQVTGCYILQFAFGSDATRLQKRGLFEAPAQLWTFHRR
jgi:hypothetical protein